MPPIPKGRTVAVTGAAGFIGGWIVRTLLDKGYRVRACVRDANDPVRTDFLKAMPGYISNRLTLHTADLNNPGCFDDIFDGCFGVAHVAHISKYGDPDYVKMVCDHIIESVNKSRTVSRVVVTSSIAAVISAGYLKEMVERPVVYEDRYPDEDSPEQSDYTRGKLQVQRAFTAAAEKSGRWDAITCCPAENVGPIQSAHQKDMGPWQHLIELMLMGKINLAVHGYRPWHTVDVRDHAACQVGLLESVFVKNGERYLAYSTDRIDLDEVCRSIDRLLPELGYATPDLTENLDEEALRRARERRAIYWSTDLRNDRIRSILPITFRPLDDSIRDCVESLLTVAKVKPVLRPGYSLQGVQA